MGDWPKDLVAPTHVHSFTSYSAAHEAFSRSGFTTPVSMTWGTANRAVYIPITLPFPYTIRRMFWINGSAAGGNHYVGIYGYDGAYIWRGTAAGSGNSVPQYVTPSAPIQISPGRYMLGYSHDSTTANRCWGYTTSAASQQRLAGFQDGAANLPTSTPTFATSTLLTIPWCGMTNTTTGY